MIELLTAAEMGTADKTAISEGVSGLTLMENAGRAVAGAALNLERGGAVAVLCGPGNNGGDGFVAARHLVVAGRTVRLGLMGDRDGLTGDAADMAALWEGQVEPLSPEVVSGAAVVIDALFGAGLARPLQGMAAEVVEAVNASPAKVVAVDVPSGLDGTTGLAEGPVIAADRTVTFFRLKPGHLLMPGRALCGEVRLADIGIPASVLDHLRPAAFKNEPALWGAHFPWPQQGGHKYSRGHVLAASGGAAATGAARLAAEGAQRIGAGLVTVASPAEALAINAAHLTAIMVTEANGADGLRAALGDTRRNAVVLGPGLGVGAETRDKVLATLEAGRPVVLDADAVTSFADRTGALFEAIAADPARPVVLTPHEGEFGRVFPDIAAASKLERARAAAARSGGIIVLKGPDTVVATPDGRAAINAAAPPWLATAGAGDVLAGMIAGLLAQGMEAFAATAAAVWLHGRAAEEFGAGLTADELGAALSVVLGNAYQDRTFGAGAFDPRSKP